MAHKHYASVGGPSSAVCAWCGQGFSANNFHSVGTWSLAVPGTATFTTPSRSTGGRARAHEMYYVQGLIPLPAARRLSPWPTSRRICSQDCLKKARAQERIVLDELDIGGEVTRSTKPIRPQSRTDQGSMQASRVPTYGLRSLSSSGLDFSVEAARSLNMSPSSRSSLVMPSATDFVTGSPAGSWLGVLKVKIHEAKNVIAHQVGHTAEMVASNCFCVVAFGRQKRCTGLVKQSLNPQFKEEFIFDVFEEDVPIGFLASPDRRMRKQRSMSVDIGLEELKAERKMRAELLRRVRGQLRPKKDPLLTVGIEFKPHDLPWDELCGLSGVDAGPDDCKLKIAIFHKPLSPAEQIKSLGTCRISALDLVGTSCQRSSNVVGRFVHPDSNMMARGIVNVSMTFKSANRCGTPQPESNNPCGNWHQHEATGTHPRPSAFSKGPGTTGTKLPGKTSRAFVQTKLLEDLPWKQIEHETERRVRVHTWDKTNTRRISCSEGTGIRQGCSPVAVSQTLRDEARYPRLLVYYIAKNQHDLAQSTIRTIRKKGLAIDTQIAEIIQAYESRPPDVDEEAEVIDTEHKSV